MADTPTPKSYNQILGSMIAAFQARFNVQKLKVGGPLLTVLEAAAQSDFRATSETFALLAASSLNSASGTALDRIAADEDTQRFGATPSTGTVIVGDSRYVKVSSVVSFSAPQPNIGSSTVTAADASAFPSTGYIYIGRGSTNYEGPLKYTSKTGNVFNFDVGVMTTKFHNYNETIILAQGGDRSIPAGSVCQTAQGGSDATTYSVLYPTTLVDGEVSVSGVQIVCQVPGVIGNVPINAISQWQTVPFTGATVSNIVSLTNGQESEDDNQLRDRLRNLRQSRTRGTPLAINTFLQGVRASDENKTILSSNVLQRAGTTATVVIDDGTGYEEIRSPITEEMLAESAVGGEQYFQLAEGRPVAKATVTTGNTAPYVLTDGSTLIVVVGGIENTHIFSAADFRSLGNATAWEVTHSINANPDLAFSASTSNGGTTVNIFAKSDTNDDIEVTGGTANSVLMFSLGKRLTCYLRKNNVLLNKDGLSALWIGNNQFNWLTMVSGDTLIVSVDGTSAVTYTFTDSDFVHAGTPYLTLSSNNSLVSWAQVITYKIAGVTASVLGSKLVLTSNAGPVIHGAIAVTGGTLTTKGMFDIGSATASSYDYSLNRNTGQLKLVSPLAIGDKLEIGSDGTSSAFVESGNLGGGAVIASESHLYWLVDANPQIIPTGVTGTTSLTCSLSSINGYLAYAIAAPPNTFSNVQVGDWCFMMDPFWGNTLEESLFRVGNYQEVGGSSVLTFDVDEYAALTPPQRPIGTFTLQTTGGLAIVRSAKRPQGVRFIANSYSATDLVDKLNAPYLLHQPINVHSTIARSFYADASTNTTGVGDFTIVGATKTASAFGLPLLITKSNDICTVGNAVSGSDRDIPHPKVMKFTYGGLTAQWFDIAPSPVLDYYSIYVALNRSPRTTAITDPKYATSSTIGAGTSKGVAIPIWDISAGAIYLPWISAIYREITPSPNEALYQAQALHFNPTDDLTVVLDGDEISKRFDLKLSRRVTFNGSNGTGLVFKDAENGGSSLYTTFGRNTDFNNYTFWRSSTGSDPTGTIASAWKFTKIGPYGDGVTVKYVDPVLPSQTAIATQTLSGYSPIVNVTLNSGAFTPVGGLNGQGIGFVAGAANWGYIVVGYKITRLQRAGDGVTVTATLAPVAGSYNCGFPLGAVVYETLPGPTGGFVSPTNGGAFTVLTSAGNQITYSETGTATQDSGVGNWGTIVIGTLAQTISGPSIDNRIYADSTQTTLPASMRGSPMITLAVPVSGMHVQVGVEATQTVTGNVVWSTGSFDPTLLNYYAVGEAINTLVSQVNAVANTPVTATTALTGVVKYPSWVAGTTLGLVPASTPWTLGSGSFGSTGFVSTAVDPSFVYFKRDNQYPSITVGETLYMIPTCAPNVAAMLAGPQFSALAQNAQVTLNGTIDKVQILTNTLGSVGSVNVVGGTANSAAATVKGVASSNGGAIVFNVPTVETSGFVSNIVYDKAPNIKVTGIVAVQKSNVINTSTLISIDATTKTFTLSAGNLQPSTSVTVTAWVERHGAFMCVRTDVGTTMAGLGSARSGDWVTFSGAGLSAHNTGTFQITFTDNLVGAIWVENPNGVDQGFAPISVTVKWIPFDGMLPGDKVQIVSDTWGTGNRQTFTVATVSSASFTTVETPVTNGAAAADATVSLRSPAPAVTWMKLLSMTPHPTATDLTVFAVPLADVTNYKLVNDGAIVTMTGKLGFVSDTISGIDAYNKTIGLVGEANKVLYGVESDPSTYPGVVAAGANVNISGPIVRRITVSLSLRLRTGSTPQQVFDGVRNAITTYVNSTKVGESLALSRIVALAGAVGGVTAVTVISPNYTVGSDMITIQPYEKAMVLSPDVDITLSITGN